MRPNLLRSDLRTGIGLLLSGLVSVMLAGCSDAGPPNVGCEQGRCVSDGDAARGKSIIAAIGCGVCHSIPGVAGANGIVGTPLQEFGRRQLIAGRIPNEASALVQWIKNAPSLSPTTGMPSLPLTQKEASDVAAYLYTLR
jgi:cytochrome c1